MKYSAVAENVVLGSDTPALFVPASSLSKPQFSYLEDGADNDGTYLTELSSGVKVTMRKAESPEQCLTQSGLRDVNYCCRFSTDQSPFPRRHPHRGSLKSRSDVGDEGLSILLDSKPFRARKLKNLELTIVEIMTTRDITWAKLPCCIVYSQMHPRPLMATVFVRASNLYAHGHPENQKRVAGFDV